jgi:hypothetical protein
VDAGYNPDRTIDLFALTTDGYIVAQDIASQYEYITMQPCPQTGKPLKVIAQINRAFQGLNELVAISTGTGEKFSFIFDISNEVYQSWWAAQMGDFYQPTYEGQPRQPDPDQRYFVE